MRIPRVLLPDFRPEQQSIWQLDRDTRHYLINVLRLKPGRELLVFDGVTEQESRATLVSADKKSAEIEILHTYPTQRESPLRIRLYLGISKPDHMDFAVQKAVELGTSEIQPLYCERSAFRSDAPKLEKKIAHWEGIITSACEQSRRCIKPTLHHPISFHQAINNTSEHSIILTPTAGNKLSELSIQESGTVTALIGPEGGFSDEECHLALQKGAQAILLGPRVLRTETAVAATLTGLQLYYGDLAN